MAVQRYAVHDTREDERWIGEVAAIEDPWHRFQKLWTTRRSFDGELERRVQDMKDEALRQALQAGTQPAFDFMEWSTTYEHWRDAYPRSPEQRQAQLNALRLVWPQVDELSRSDRVDLVRMAERCHLHEAQQPGRRIVIACLRFGAKSLELQRQLASLIDVASLGEPLLD